MSQSIPTLSVPAGVSAEDFTRLLAKGKRQGSLTPDEVMHVLERVELSHDLIDSIRSRLAAEGIKFDEVADVVDVDDDEALAPSSPRTGARWRRRLPQAPPAPRTPPRGRRIPMPRCAA